MSKQLTKISLVGSGTFNVPAGVTVGLVAFRTATPKQPAASGAMVNTDKVTRLWGINAAGRLGDGTIVAKSSPVAILGGHEFLNIVSGQLHTAALKADGSAWCWGQGVGGALGDNTAVAKSSPVQVVGGHKFVKLAIKGNGVMALKANGSLWVWGGNLNGESATGAFTTTSSPVPVLGGTNYQDMDYKGSFSVLLDKSGNAWASGSNNYGQLGSNGAILTSAYVSSPVQVVGGHTFVQVATDSAAVFGLKANGEVWSWGYNASGHLGDGTTVNKSSPVQVVGGHAFIKIVSNQQGGCAGLKANGEVWAWGVNTNGELGDGTTVNKSSPVQVVGGHVFSDIFSGYRNIVALKADRSLWSWGINAAGDVGDNTFVNKSSPVQVVGGYLVNLSAVKSSAGLSYVDLVPNENITYGGTSFKDLVVPDGYEVDLFIEI